MSALRRTALVTAAALAALAALAAPAWTMPRAAVETPPTTTLILAFVLALLFATLILPPVFKRIPKDEHGHDQHEGAH